MTVEGRNVLSPVLLCGQREPVRLPALVAHYLVCPAYTLAVGFFRNP